MSITKAEFIKRYGGIYEHSPWIAEAAYGAGDIPAAMKRVVENGTYEQKLALIRAHPDLAGKLGVLTKESASEQKGAGLDQCSPEEFAEFQKLNDAYKNKFGFPFIIAVKGHTRQSILENFRVRLHNDKDTEFAAALEQIHKIAGFRLEALKN
jgi:2-oxo-4-hydroxy-4-carboxy-5-ureidoimidazoline decarboxylase